MKQQTYFFTGKLTTLEPLTVSLGTGLAQGIPRHNGIPYFPSSSIIGAFRSAACKHIWDTLIAENPSSKMTLDTIYGLGQGFLVNNDVVDQVNKQGTSLTVAVDENMDLRKANPLLSINGRWGLAGKWGIGSAYCQNSEQVSIVKGGFRGDIIIRDSGLLNLMSPPEVERYYNLSANQTEKAADVGQLKKDKTALLKRIKSASEEEKAELKLQAAEIDKEIAAIKNESGEGRETLRRPLDDLEAIQPAVDMQHRMTLSRGTEIELGLMLFAIGKFSQSPRFGGKARWNWGAVHGYWKVSVPTDDYGRKEIGAVGFDDNGFYVEGEALQAALELTKSVIKTDAVTLDRLV